MAYARMGDDSDVYVWLGRGWECSGCRLVSGKRKWFYTEDRQAMINHLHAHREAGHLVPQRAIDRLQRELDTEDDNE